MTLRERIADWISGGALTRAVKSAKAFEDDGAKWFDIAINAQDRADKWQRESNEGWTTATTRLIALQSIIAQEKPTSNATVKRMARIAREAME